MSLDEIYNPLDKRHLADSIARAFFRRPILPLPPLDAFRGAGIYAIYYKGNYPLYKALAESFERLAAEANRADFDDQPIPIYIGKSDAPGSRKGIAVSVSTVEGTENDDERSDDLKEAEEFLTKKPTHKKLYNRLVKHSKSIAAANENLRQADFFCRYMLVDEIWVPLGEARLVELFKPLWNVLIEGFGSNPEGGGRKKTARPVWDILHPGRKDYLGIRVDPASEASILSGLRGAKTIDALRSAIEVHRRGRLAFNKTQRSAGESDEDSQN